MNLPKIYVNVLGAVLLMLLFGCQTTEQNLGEELNTASEKVFITQGMPAEELLASIGEPTEVIQSEQEGMEVWVYEKRASVVSFVVTGTKETPFFDPITGEYRPIIDQVFGNERTSIREETRFLVGEGKVIRWEVERKNRREYD